MSPIMGFVGGLAGLALLDAAVSSPSTGNGATVASGSLGGLFGLATKFLQIVIDPTRPGIADHSKAASTTTSTATPSSTGSGVNNQGITVKNKSKPKSATNPQILFPSPPPLVKF